MDTRLRGKGGVRNPYERKVRDTNVARGQHQAKPKNMAPKRPFKMRKSGGRASGGQLNCVAKKTDFSLKHTIRADDHLRASAGTYREDTKRRTRKKGKRGGKQNTDIVSYLEGDLVLPNNLENNTRGGRLLKRGQENGEQGGTGRRCDGGGTKKKTV